MRPVGLVALFSLHACASSSSFHEGPTALAPKERTALAATVRKQNGGFERFWRRPGVAIGIVKWSEDRSSAVPSAPLDLLQAIRDEVGRANRSNRAGEAVYVSVTVFGWKRSLFSRTLEVGYEVVGRDRVGQVLWMGEDMVRPTRDFALNLAESDQQIAAREIGRKLRKELGL
jgi:hypothetical protein